MPKVLLDIRRQVKPSAKAVIFWEQPARLDDIRPRPPAPAAAAYTIASRASFAAEALLGVYCAHTSRDVKNKRMLEGRDLIKSANANLTPREELRQWLCEEAVRRHAERTGMSISDARVDYLKIKKETVDAVAAGVARLCREARKKRLRVIAGGKK